MTLPIYLDYAATTPMDPRVVQAMHEHMTHESLFGNPASTTHIYGQQAAAAIETARAQVARLINALPQEIIWTSGATEANNLAIKGVARFYHNKGKHLITTKTEHKAVLDVCADLERQGYTVTYLTPETSGLIDIEQLAAAIRPDTILVSMMHVNNEIGVIQDIAAIAELCRSHKVLLHVDAAQSVGKLAIDLQALPVDLMSFSAHKIYGPKGIGALYVRSKPKVRLTPLLHGGAQEQGLRAGTLATHQIVGMGTAFALATDEMPQEIARIRILRDRLWQGIADIPGVQVNGCVRDRVAHNLNISVSGVDGEALVTALYGIAISSGSACTSSSIEPSHVLQALGVEARLAHSSLRLTLGRYTTEADIDFAVRHIREQVERLRGIMAPPLLPCSLREERVGERREDLLLDHFHNPRNIGKLDPSDPTVATGRAQTSDGSTKICLQLQFKNLKVTEACFQALGGVATIAACSWVTEWTIGKNLQQLQELSSLMIIQTLQISEKERYSALLVENALREIIKIRISQ